MRFVIYDELLEPITVVSLPGLNDRDIEEHGRFWRLPVHERMRLPTWRELQDETITTMTKVKVVDLKFEPIRRGDHTGWMVFTKQDEWAMMLDSILLPGQAHDQVDLRKINAAITDVLIKGLFRDLRGH